MTPKEILKFIKENSIEIVDLKFNDPPELRQHFSIPASELTGTDLWYTDNQNSEKGGEN